MLVTFEPLLRFYFYKMLDRSELNFLLIDHLSTCDFAKSGLCWNYLQMKYHEHDYDMYSPTNNIKRLTSVFGLKGVRIAWFGFSSLHTKFRHLNLLPCIKLVQNFVLGCVWCVMKINFSVQLWLKLNNILKVRKWEWKDVNFIYRVLRSYLDFFDNLHKIYLSGKL